MPVKEILPDAARCLSICWFRKWIDSIEFWLPGDIYG